jgi:hypothetical protein
MKVFDGSPRWKPSMDSLILEKVFDGKVLMEVFDGKKKPRWKKIYKGKFRSSQSVFIEFSSTTSSNDFLAGSQQKSVSKQGSK